MLPEYKRTIFQAYAPERNMRIYGRGIRRRLAPMLSEAGHKVNRQKVELAFSLLFSSPGAPLIMYGDEIGIGENLELPGRDAARTPMQWSKEKNAGFSSAERLIAPVNSEGPFGYENVNVCDQWAEAGSFLYYIKDLIAVRKNSSEIGFSRVQVLEVEGNCQQVLVSGYPAIDDSQENISLILFHNLSVQSVSATVNLRHASGNSFRVLFGNGSLNNGKQEKLTVDLPAFGHLWLRV
jgi:maltose alpha-D-glucosyltransferase/alpha-amylase